MSTDTKPSVVRYEPTPQNDLMQVYEGREVGTLGVQLGPDTADLFAASPELLDAVQLYVKLDNDRRAGCEITEADWAECHQAAREAIQKATRTSRRLRD